MEEQIIPTCPNCGEPMVLKTKGTDKFWGCPAWKERGCKTISYGKTRPKSKPEVRRTEKVDPILMVLNELQDFRKEVNERLDNMSDYLGKKLK